MRRVRLTEEQLHRIIRNAVNESFYYDRVKNVDGSGDHANFKVSLWPGYGYFLCEFTVKADDMEEALEKVVAYLDKTHDSALFADRDLKSLDDEEIEDMEDDGQIMDVDATEFGAYSTHYIWTENLKFEEI
jgi:predicted small metal-binding protein